MRIRLAVISVITGLLVTGCSSGSSEITFTPMFQEEEITVPGVQKECKSEYRERAEEIIKLFYTNNTLGPYDHNWILSGPSQNCFNDAILADYAYENSPEAYRKEVKEKIFDVYRENGSKSLYDFDRLKQLNHLKDSETGNFKVLPNVFDLTSLEHMKKIQNKFFKS